MRVDAAHFGVEGLDLSHNAGYACRASARVFETPGAPNMMFPHNFNCGVTIGAWS